MCDRWGVARVLAPLIANLPQSESFDAALRATYHVTQSDFEERWQRDVGSRYGWLSLAGALGFFLLALGSGLAALVLLRRRPGREKRAALETEENQMLYEREINE